MAIGEAARRDPALWGRYEDLTQLLEDNARRMATPCGEPSARRKDDDDAQGVLDDRICHKISP
ncbi:hypothetical protein DV26_43625 [Amycolatopsis mediterranei]|nr:hypothetical protein DV26_43625 [Amycolatopsis mediterranei]